MKHSDTANRQPPVPWRLCEFVSIANAARIAGRSPAWAADMITAGRLDARRLPTGGPPVVTVASLRALLDAAELIVRPARTPVGAPPVRLAVDNT